MQAPFQRLRSYLLCSNRLQCMLLNIIILGNVCALFSFAWPSNISIEMAHAKAALPYSVPLTPTVVAMATTNISFTILEATPTSTSIATSTPIPTDTPTPTPTPTLTPTPTPTPTPTLLPDVGISQTIAGNATVQTGQTVSYTLRVVSTSPGGPIPSQFVKVKDVLPIGLKNVTVTGTNWAIIMSSSVSPVLIASTYRGQYPIAPGTALPPIIVTGTVSSDAPSSITCTALAGVSGDSNPDNNIANNTIYVAPPSS